MEMQLHTASLPNFEPKFEAAGDIEHEHEHIQKL